MIVKRVITEKIPTAIQKGEIPVFLGTDFIDVAWGFCFFAAVFLGFVVFLSLTWFSLTFWYFSLNEFDDFPVAKSSIS